MWHLIALYVLPLFPFLGLLWSPCCCASCQFFSDDFSSNDIANYTQVSGSTWAIDTGAHTLSSSDVNGILTGNTANPNGDANTKILVTVDLDTSGDTARIILAYLNSSNYWFGELKVGGSGYIAIYQRSGGGVPVLKASTSYAFPINTVIPVCASIRNQYMSFAALDGSLAAVDYNVGSTTDSGYGLGTGSSNSGTVTFGETTTVGGLSFSGLKVSTSTGDGCTACPGQCNACTDNLSPFEWELVVAGLTNGSCGTCTSANATYIIPPSAPPLTECNWDLTVNPGVCGHTDIFAVQAQTGTHGLGGTININTPVGPNTFAGFDDGVATPIDCINVTSHSVTKVSGFDGTCGQSSATFTITALV